MNGTAFKLDAPYTEFEHFSGLYPAWKILADGTIVAPGGRRFFPHSSRPAALCGAASVYRGLLRANPDAAATMHTKLSWRAFCAAAFDCLARSPDAATVEDAGIALQHLVEAVAHRLEWADVLTALGGEVT